MSLLYNVLISAVGLSKTTQFWRPREGLLLSWMIMLNDEINLVSHDAVTANSTNKAETE